MSETSTTMNDDVAREFRALLEAAQSMTSELGPDITSMLEEGLTRSLAPDDAERLLLHVVEAIRSTATAKDDGQTVNDLSSDLGRLIELASAARERIRRAPTSQPSRMAKRKTVELLAVHNGVEAGAVVPRPVFHEKEIPMLGGYIKTVDINLWGDNERLELHVAQFKAKSGRPPTPDELLQIMIGKMPLEGVDPGDSFKIMELARSIAANGVRKPPIIDVDGSLLDGNRRMAACRLILADSSGDFRSEEKQRLEHIFVWQLTQFATDDDRRRVVVSLNFESDCKKDWPEYIKARRVYEEWEGMLAVEPQKPGPRRQAEMKRELSRKYALGPSSDHVNRYLKMISWANDFEDHHINARNRDQYSVKHAASRYFQYFEELGKGEKPGGVAWSLNQDDRFKGIVFDLLFDGKFENWRQIRALKHVFDSDEAREILGKAHNEAHVDTAQEHVDNAVTIANTKRAELRQLGANVRIEGFTKWLEEIPLRALRDQVKPQNLERLRQALRLVDRIAEEILPDTKVVGV
jgi:hypothetical protein